jgi:hypothetical protein
MALAAGAFLALVWLALDPGSRTPPEAPVPTPASETDSSTPVTPSEAPEPIGPEPTGPPAPALRIPEGGRLSLEAASLPEGEPLALGLDLGDEARGATPRPVVIVSTDGRRSEAFAVPTAGRGSGVRLELEPGFLAPGRYMLQVTTAEKIPLHFRRYVLEVQ